MALSAIEIAFFVANKMHTLKAPLIFARLEEDVQCQNFWDVHHVSFVKLMKAHVQVRCQVLRLDLHKGKPKGKPKSKSKGKPIRFARIHSVRNRTVH